jgi:phenylalanine-4-hydroxylase
LGITEDRIPDLDEINEILESRSGFRGVFVKGLENGENFFRMLSKREFPVGNFIRGYQDIGYTPAPDIVHDLYGHLPFFTDRDYGDFCRDLGAVASRYGGRPGILRQFERFFWFTVEFGLIDTRDGLRIFGAGIASSLGECEYALSGVPEILPFSVDAVRQQEFRIDVLQPKLFCLESLEQLYGSLGELSRKVELES